MHEAITTALQSVAIAAVVVIIYAVCKLLVVTYRRRATAIKRALWVAGHALIVGAAVMATMLMLIFVLLLPLFDWLERWSRKILPWLVVITVLWVLIRENKTAAANCLFEWATILGAVYAGWILAELFVGFRGDSSSDTAHRPSAASW